MFLKSDSRRKGTLLILTALFGSTVTRVFALPLNQVECKT